MKNNLTFNIKIHLKVIQKYKLKHEYIILYQTHQKLPKVH